MRIGHLQCGKFKYLKGMLASSVIYDQVIRITAPAQLYTKRGILSYLDDHHLYQHHWRRRVLSLLWVSWSG